MTRAYYNEHDKFAAAWLRELIADGLIAPGDVDERSIEDVTPAELVGYRQCHFFAGIGVWSLALRLAGWPDDREIWTGSCPCQPFSAAGKRGGTTDERHLWPAFHHLISQCRPPVVFGEQVASKDGLGWLDLVHADLEAAGYAVGAVDLCAAGVGAPHIRQRLWFVGERVEHAEIDGRQQWGTESGERGAVCGCGLVGVADADKQQLDRRGNGWPRRGREPSDIGAVGRLGHDDDEGLEGLGSGHQAPGGRLGETRPVAATGESGGVGDAAHQPRERLAGGVSGAQTSEHGQRVSVDGSLLVGSEHASAGIGGVADAGDSTGQRGQPRAIERGLPAQFGKDAAVWPGPTNGHWRVADWLFCRDGKWRPVESGTFPLAHGAAARVGRLRAYGNAIVAQAAEEVINAYLETKGKQ